MNRIGYMLSLAMSIALYGADNTDKQNVLLQAFKESSMYALLKTSSDEKHDTYAEYEASEITSDSHDLSSDSHEDTDSTESDNTSNLLRQLYKHADRAIIIPKSIAYIIKQLEKHDSQLQSIVSQQNAQREQMRSVMLLLDNIERRIDIVCQKIQLGEAEGYVTELSIHGSTVRRIPHKKE